MKIVWVLVLAGCAGAVPSAEKEFGHTTRQTLAQQIRAPSSEVPQTRSPDGMAGPAAREVMERYVKSFSAPPPAGTVFNIGLSSGEAK